MALHFFRDSCGGVCVTAEEIDVIVGALMGLNEHGESLQLIEGAIILARTDDDDAKRGALLERIVQTHVNAGRLPLAPPDASDDAPAPLPNGAEYDLGYAQAMNEAADAIRRTHVGAPDVAAMLAALATWCEGKALSRGAHEAPPALPPDYDDVAYHKVRVLEKDATTPPLDDRSDISEPSALLAAIPAEIDR